MNKTLSEGDPVRITDGVYAELEGIVEDLQPECSTVRVHTKEGTAYAYTNHVQQVLPPLRTTRGRVIKK